MKSMQLFGMAARPRADLRCLFTYGVVSEIGQCKRASSVGSHDEKIHSYCATIRATVV
jgi:exo-beta-1,3-glucanase (GH17 family)